MNAKRKMSTQQLIVYILHKHKIIQHKFYK